MRKESGFRVAIKRAIGLVMHRQTYRFSKKTSKRIAINFTQAVSHCSNSSAFAVISQRASGARMGRHNAVVGRTYNHVSMPQLLVHRHFYRSSSGLVARTPCAVGWFSGRFELSGLYEQAFLVSIWIDGSQPYFNNCSFFTYLFLCLCSKPFWDYQRRSP